MVENIYSKEYGNRRLLTFIIDWIDKSLSMDFYIYNYIIRLIIILWEDLG